MLLLRNLCLVLAMLVVPAGQIFLLELTNVGRLTDGRDKTSGSRRDVRIAGRAVLIRGVNYRTLVAALGAQRAWTSAAKRNTRLRIQQSIFLQSGATLTSAA